MTNLSGRVALVTGGSVAMELARASLKAGADVAFIYRNPSRKAELDEAFTDYSDIFLPIRADLADANQTKEVVDEVKERFGGIDFLLNSLGGWLGGKKLHEHTSAELQKMLLMDLIPTFNIMSAVLPIMSDQKFGRIVNFVSLQAFGTGAGNSVYAASKSAVLSLSKAAAEEYKDSGVSVYTVAPSIIDTASNRKSMTGSNSGRWVSMDEIVEAVMFLCCAGDSLNGTTLKFSGMV